MSYNIDMYIDAPYSEGRELPSFSLRQIDLPDFLQWQVGSQHYIVMKVEMTGVRNRKDLEQSNDQPKMEADFSAISIRALGDEPVSAKEIEKKEFDELVVRARSGNI